MNGPRAALKGFIVSRLFAVCLVRLFIGSTSGQIVVDTSVDENDTPAGSYVSLREAMRDALTGQTVTFAPALDGQVIILTGGTIIVSGKSVAVDASALTTGLVLQVSSAVRHFDVAAAAALSLTNVSVQGRRPAYSGGGIQNAGTLTLTDCVLRDNLAAPGQPGSPGINGHPPSTPNGFDYQNAGRGGPGTNGGNGGALVNTGSVSVMRTRFLNNTAGDGGQGGYGGGGYYGSATEQAGGGGDSGNGGKGGAIWSSGSVSLSVCMFSGNQSGSGPNGGQGGYYQGYGPNGRGGSGGDGGSVWQSGPLTISGSTFRGNFCGSGGSGGSPALSQAEGSGAGLYLAAGAATVTNSTFTGNAMNPSAGFPYLVGVGAGICVASVSPAPSLTLTHCTVTGNTSRRRNTGLDCSAGLYAGSGSHIFENCLIAGNKMDLTERNMLVATGTASITPASVFTDFPVVDPKLGAAVVFPGNAAPVHPLLSDSPALNGGVALAGAPATDQRGLPRTVGAPDLGAVEMQASEPASLKPQSIDFPQLSDRDWNGSPFDVTLTATASSGLPVSLTLLSGPATLAGNTLTVTGSGFVSVRAVQAGNAEFEVALTVTRTLRIRAAGVPDSDADGDGVNDFIEMVFGTSTAPGSHDPSPLTVEFSAGGNISAVLARRPINLYGRSVTIQLSNNLAAWTDAPAAQTTVSANPDELTQRVAVVMNPAGGPAWRFTRLLVADAP